MTRIADVYARALYDLARDEGLDGEILEQLAVLGQAFAAEPEYLRLLSAPAIPKQERCGMVDEGFRGKVHRYVLSFLKLLTYAGCIMLSWNSSSSLRWECFLYSSTVRSIPVPVISVYLSVSRSTVRL